MSEERSSNRELWEYREETMDGSLNSTGIRALRFTEQCLVFEAGRMIMAFSDGETEARQMISLGTKLTLEVRSVASEQGLQWMGVMVMRVCVWRERESSSFCLGSEEPAGTGVAVLEEEDIPP